MSSPKGAQWCEVARKSMAPTLSDLSASGERAPAVIPSPRSCAAEGAAVRGRQHQNPRFSHRWSRVEPASEAPTHSDDSTVAVIDVAYPGLLALRSSQPRGCRYRRVLAPRMVEIRHRRRHSFSGHSAPTLACRPAHVAALKGGCTSCIRRLTASLSSRRSPCDPPAGHQSSLPLDYPPSGPQPDTHRTPAHSPTRPHDLSAPIVTRSQPLADFLRLRPPRTTGYSDRR
ncbi:MAG: hypothetical protein ACI8RZ_003124 [Myxococcota bacterium]|jgi:hypothetical protein